MISNITFRPKIWDWRTHERLLGIIKHRCIRFVFRSCDKITNKNLRKEGFTLAYRLMSYFFLHKRGMLPEPGDSCGHHLQSRSRKWAILESNLLSLLHQDENQRILLMGSELSTLVLHHWYAVTMCHIESSP